MLHIEYEGFSVLDWKYIGIHENEKKYLNNKWMCMGSPYNLYREPHV